MDKGRRVDHEAVRQVRHAREIARRYAKIAQDLFGESVGVPCAKLGQEIAIGNVVEHAGGGARPQPERHEPPLAVIGIARERAIRLLDAIVACEVIRRQNRNDARAAFEGVVHLRHRDSSVRNPRPAEALCCPARGSTARARSRRLCPPPPAK